jgi:hypothetical protein
MWSRISGSPGRRRRLAGAGRGLLRSGPAGSRPSPRCRDRRRCRDRGQGGLDVAEGLVEADAADGPQIGEIVEGVGVAGIEPDAGLELLDGAVGLAGLVKGDADTRNGTGASARRPAACRRDDGKGLFEFPHGPGGIFLGEVEAGEVGVDGGAFGGGARGERAEHAGGGLAEGGGAGQGALHIEFQQGGVCSMARRSQPAASAVRRRWVQTVA